MNKPDFRVVAHTADLKIEVRAKTLEQLYADCAHAMFLSMMPRTDQSDCKYTESGLVCKSLPQVRDVVVEARDKELLLVDFLSEALYLSDVHHEAYLHIVVHIKGNSLTACLSGVAVVGWDASHIKAVTYSDLAVEQRGGHWFACVVFDI